MPDQIPAAAFAGLLRTGRPLLDLRAPVEFRRGALPGATNLPLLTDEERTAVGIQYRKAGREAAVALGEKLVAGDTKNRRIRRWCEFLEKQPDSVLYCFRGGLRSTIVQDWLRAEGWNIPLISGGYKALRGFCLNTLESMAGQREFLVIGGKTGCGKTHVLKKLDNMLDLEANANHRGSAFGRRTREQPGQVDFENQLAVELLKLDMNRAAKIFVEDEGRAIGSINIPAPLFQKMNASPLAIIEEPLAFRANTILHDYIISDYHEYRLLAPDRYGELFAGSLLSALARIRRRLGETHFCAVRELMEQALAAGAGEESLALHRAWISRLLRDYYDPMYEYQLARKSRRIVFRGNQREFLDWAITNNQ